MTIVGAILLTLLLVVPALALGLLLGSYRVALCARGWLHHALKLYAAGDRKGACEWILIAVRNDRSLLQWRELSEFYELLVADKSDIDVLPLKAAIESKPLDPFRVLRAKFRHFRVI